MAGTNKKLEALSDDITWFACATEVRAHFVLAEPDLHETVLRIILRGSRLTERPTPYLVFAEPFAGQDAGWAERIGTLEEARAVLTEELGARGRAVEPFVPADPNAQDIRGFAVRLRDLAQATAQACAPPVVVLAPAHIEAPERWAKEFEKLLDRPELASVRWSVVVESKATVARLIEGLGELALVSDCRSSLDESRALLGALVANAEAAGPQAPAHAALGMAWPRVAPPPRRSSSGAPLPTHEPTAEERARQATRGELLRGALALSSQKGPEALGHFRAAADQLGAAGLEHEALVVQLMRATTVATAGDSKLACRELDAVADHALRLKKPAIAAQAASAKAALLAAGRDTEGAIEAYQVAIQAARAAGEDARPLLVELLRAAGQLCLEARQEERGVACFREALSTAEMAPPSAAAGAAEVARAFGAACRKRGMNVQADSLEAQAARLELRALSSLEPRPAAQESA